MKILITGAGGFLGSEVVRLAVAQGHQVRAMVRPGVPTDGLALGPGSLVHCDLTDPSCFPDVVQGIEGVIHCAAVTSQLPSTEAWSRRVNVEGTARLFAAAHEAGVQRWVQISSMSAHPDSTSIYGRTKREADERLRAAEPPPQWTILRPSLIYGPGEQGLVARTTSSLRRLPVIPIIGPGRAPIRPVYVSDIADAALKCLQLPQAIGKTYMLGGADEVTLNEFMRRLAAHAGLNRRLLHLPVALSLFLARALEVGVKNPPITVDNVLGVREVQPVDDTAARREWAWKPIGLEEGLRRSFAEPGRAN